MTYSVEYQGKKYQGDSFPEVWEKIRHGRDMAQRFCEHLGRTPVDLSFSFYVHDMENLSIEKHICEVTGARFVMVTGIIDKMDDRYIASAYDLANRDNNNGDMQVRVVDRLALKDAEMPKGGLKLHMLADKRWEDEAVVFCTRTTADYLHKVQKLLNILNKTLTIDEAFRL